MLFVKLCIMILLNFVLKNKFFNVCLLGKLNVDCCNYLYFFLDLVNILLKIGIINLKYKL